MEGQPHGQEKASLCPRRPHSARLVDVPSVFGQMQLLPQEKPVVPPPVSHVFYSFFLFLQELRRVLHRLPL